MQYQSIKGMPDIPPAECAHWQHLEQVTRALMQSYGYSEIRLPIMEKTPVFTRAIGDVTDIVQKEMYTFSDRNGDQLSLRPEGTAGCVRAVLQHGLLHNQIQRLWYAGSMFRHERPQKGRLREFHQIGVEAYGMAEADIDAELILMSARLWRRLGLDHLKLEINSLGTPAAREAYRTRLVKYFSAHISSLDEDSRARLDTNPLRILDSKAPEMQALIQAAPAMQDSFDAQSHQHFAQLRACLDAVGLEYRVNPVLVRGIDYYSHTVFEWLSDRLGAQSAVCAGGRYDGLVDLLGGRATPAVGFAMGLERLLDLLRQEDNITTPTQATAYLVLAGSVTAETGLKWAEILRDALPGMTIIGHCGTASLKSQLRRADKTGSRWALIVGDDELRDEIVSVKFLRDDTPQVKIPLRELGTFLDRQLA